MRLADFLKILLSPLSKLDVILNVRLECTVQHHLIKMFGLRVISAFKQVDYISVIVTIGTLQQCRAPTS